MYRAIAGMFPREFKDSYGDELLQVTEGAMDSIQQRLGRLGLLRMLLDVAFRVVAERTAQFGRNAQYWSRSFIAATGFTLTAVSFLESAISIVACWR